MECKTGSEKHCMSCNHYDYCDKANCCNGDCYRCDDNECENNPEFKLKENTAMTRERQKNEAIERMKMLKMHPNVIREFTEDYRLNLSETCGILYWLDEQQQQHVEKFENKYNAVVYHVIRSFTEYGELLTFIYVSAHKDEWGYDRDDLKEGYACAYVKNLDDEMCSEFGSVCIKPSFGGLLRTA